MGALKALAQLPMSCARVGPIAYLDLDRVPKLLNPESSHGKLPACAEFSDPPIDQGVPSFGRRGLKISRHT